MKTISYFLCLASLSALTWDYAVAETVTVNVTARVSSVFDSGNILGGQVVPGQVFTGRYVYDTSAPRYLEAPNFARYNQQGAMASTRLALGSLAFESDSPPLTWAEMRILANAPNAGWDQLFMNYQGNRTLANGATVQSIDFMFTDPSGQMPHTIDLPATAPNLQGYEQKQIQIQGGLNSNWYTVSFQIETATLLAPLTIEISPGASNFLPQQRFDAALIPPPGSAIASVQASANGIPLPLNYPGTCQFTLANSADRPAVLCPDAHLALALVPGATQVEWRVELKDGTILNQAVEWKLIP